MSKSINLMAEVESFKSQEEQERLIQITKKIFDFNLTEVEKSVIIMNFGLDNSDEFTETQIAQKLSTSINNVRRIISSALRKLRDPSIFNSV